jgi:hypothetical protein
MLKKDEIENPKSCLNKAADDEPVFVVKARDILAAGTVRYWVNSAIAHGVPKEKWEEAQAIADQMDRWPNRKIPD